ncbi:MAG: hypothetical protein AAB893_00835, partial [Patescibacteria group bacterium]
MRIDLPGMMKFVNDHLPESYRGGNALIQFTAERIINFFHNECGISNIRMMRRGVDFYVIIPRSSKSPPVSFVDLLLYSQKLQDSLMQSCISFISQRDGIEVSSGNSSDWYVPCVAGYSLFSGSEIVPAMDKVDHEVKHNTLFRVEELINSSYTTYMRAVDDAAILEKEKEYSFLFKEIIYLGNYFNVYEKRGPERLQEQLNVNDQEITSFIEFYESDYSKIKNGGPLYRFTNGKKQQMAFLKKLTQYSSQKK